LATKAQLQQQVGSDLALWKVLTSSGDDPSQPHTIDRFFVAKEERPLCDLAHLAKILMYAPGAISQSQQAKFSLTITSQATTAMLHNFVRESILMYALAEAHGVEYAGWETAVVRVPANGT